MLEMVKHLKHQQLLELSARMKHPGKWLWSLLALVLMVSDIEKGTKRRHDGINADKFHIRWREVIERSVICQT